MVLRRFIFLFFVLAAFPPVSYPADTERPSPQMEITDSAKPITATAGKTFSIVLPAGNRGAGYSWQLARPLDQKVLKFAGSTFVPSGPDLDGSAGTEKLSFIAVGKGCTSVFLKYVRVWEKAVPPTQETVFTVTVE